MLLFNRPTVQEDGGDILFKVCRNFVFYVQIGHMVYRNDARLLELQKFNFRWVMIIDGSSAGTTIHGFGQIDLD